MSPPAKSDHRTCPPIPRTSGHNPAMPIPAADNWTCPRKPSLTTGHALRGPAPVDIAPLCPFLGQEIGHVLDYQVRRRDMSRLGPGSWACPGLPKPATGYVRPWTWQPDMSRQQDAAKLSPEKGSAGTLEPAQSSGASLDRGELQAAKLSPRKPCGRSLSGRSGSMAGSPKEPAIEPITPTPKACHMFDKIVTRRSRSSGSSSVLWKP